MWGSLPLARLFLYFIWPNFTLKCLFTPFSLPWWPPQAAPPQKKNKTSIRKY